MRAIFCVIIGIFLFFSATYAGFSVFSMYDDMASMASIDCVNYCIDQATVVSVLPTVLSAIVSLLFVLFVFPHRLKPVAITVSRFFQRITEPIRLSLLQIHLSPVLIRD